LPEGFEVPGKEHMALKLKKALYGTKQGGNQWRKTLEEFMEKLGWTCSKHDQAVFFRALDDELWAIVGFWVDDTMSVGDSSSLKTHLVNDLVYQAKVMHSGYLAHSQLRC
jgi:Reverse transcriptase (RNA-dependent DNA polymerase)